MAQSPPSGPQEESGTYASDWGPNTDDNDAGWESPELEAIDKTCNGENIQVTYTCDLCHQIRLISRWRLGVMTVYQHFHAGGSPSTFSTHYQTNVLENGIQTPFNTVAEVISYINSKFRPNRRLGQTLVLSVDHAQTLAEQLSPLLNLLHTRLVRLERQSI